MQRARGRPWLGKDQGLARVRLCGRPMLALGRRLAPDPAPAMDRSPREETGGGGSGGGGGGGGYYRLSKAGDIKSIYSIYDILYDILRALL